MTHHNFSASLRRQWPQLAHALRGTAAALAALAVAERLHLECPYWAAMTAIIVIQPTRGLLFAKSFYRLVGTATGSLAGLILLRHAGSPWLLTFALALWVAGCVGVGNLLYGLRSYACMMAGFTCVIIALSGYQDPPHLYAFAFGRIAGVCIGIAVATLVTACFTPNPSRAELAGRLRRVSAEAVRWLALLLREGRSAEPARLEREILVELAEIEGLLDVVGAGSLRFRKEKRRSRSLIAVLLSLLAVGRLAAESLARHPGPEPLDAPWRQQLARHLERVCELLAGAKTVHCLTEMAATVAAARAHHPLLGETLGDLVPPLRQVLANSGGMAAADAGESAHELTRHREWHQATRAAVRAALAIAAVGTVWAASGWRQGPIMLMTLAIMLSIFSAKEHPAAFLGKVFLGAAAGSATAVLCRIFLLPGLTDPLLAGAVIAPFLLLGVFAMTQRRTAAPATDATMFFIFVTQPGGPLAVVPHDLLAAAFAMVLGVGGAWLSYRYLVAIDPAIRMRSLLEAAAREIAGLAATAAPAARQRLRARIQHRVIRLVALAVQFDREHHRLVEDGLAALAVHRCIQRLQEAQASAELSPEARRLCRQALDSLGQSARDPQGALRLLEAVALAAGGVPGIAAEGERPADRLVADALRSAVSLFGGSGRLWAGRGRPCPS